MKRIVLLLGIVTAIVAFLAAFETHAQGNNVNDKIRTEMRYQDIYPVFVTKDLTVTKQFYEKWFGLKPVFESGFFILLTSDDGSRSIGFLSEVHPSSPPSSPAMNAQAGIFLTMQVEDAQADYKRLKDAGLKMSYHLKDEPWGQRRFGVVDPNGMYIDIVEQIEPEKGFWEKYPAKN